MRRTILIAAALGGLSGCADRGAPSGAPPDFACPAAGTRVSYGGAVTEWRGPAEDDPFVCMRRVGGSAPTRSLAAFWTMPLPDDAAIRAGMWALWPLTPGRTTTYRFHAYRRGGEYDLIEHTWRVIGPREAVLAGQNRRVIELEQDVYSAYHRNNFFSWTYLFDTESRVFIQRVVREGRFFVFEREFSPTSIHVPSPP